jgi:hypothetical protein
MVWCLASTVVLGNFSQIGVPSRLYTLASTVVLGNFRQRAGSEGWASSVHTSEYGQCAEGIVSTPA